MDTEILEQLKNISTQLEKITKLLEEKKTFAPRPGGAEPKKSFGFGGKKDFGPRKDFGAKKSWGQKPYDRPRFNSDGKPRVIADGRPRGFKKKSF